MVLLSAPPSPTLERPGVAVLEMKAIAGVDRDLARLVNEVLLARVGMSGVFGNVIGSSDIEEMISLEQQKAILGCEEESCIAQLGGALGVPLMMVPVLGRVGGNYVITLKLTDVEAAQVLVRQILVVPKEQDLTKGMEWVVKATLATYQKQAPPKKPRFEPKRDATLPIPTWFRPLGMGLVAAGGLAIGGSYHHHQVAVTAYGASDHLATAYQDFVDRTAEANQILTAGILTTVIGAALWRLAP